MVSRSSVATMRVKGLFGVILIVLLGFGSGCSSETKWQEPQCYQYEQTKMEFLFNPPTDPGLIKNWAPGGPLEKKYIKDCSQS